jgi:hypothetical protein
LENKSRLSEIPLVPFVTSGMVHLTLDKKVEKDGRRPKDVGQWYTLPRRPSFSPCYYRQCAPFRRERSERAESQTSHRFIFITM